jgi:Rad3-related DNA helicase
MTTPIPTPATPPDFFPTDLGLPTKFSQWRPGQYSSIIQAIESPKRFIAMSLPTGTGKSLGAMAIAILNAKRAVINTSTKGLEDQYGNDFSECGLVDLRGRQNYDCRSHGTCADGRLSGCPHMVKSEDTPADCPYAAARESFLSSKITVTNYACYFANVMHGEGMGKIDLLILDEAHDVLEQLSTALTIVLDHNAYESVCKKSGLGPIPIGQPLSQWRDWAKNAIPVVKSLFDQVKKEGGHSNWLRVIDSVKGILTRISTVPDSWIVDDSKPGETSIAPLWPTDYAEEILFRGIEKVLLISATIVPKTLELLGIPHDQYTFISTAHAFDPRRSPVYLFGASRIDFRSTPGQLAEMVGRMDAIIGRRLDRKGIIHTVSYDRADYILNHSAHRGLMIAPRGKMLHDSLKLFRESDPPRILISPAITTGYDFAGSQAEYQFIIKVPFIDARSPIMKARAAADPEYLPYLTAQILTQTCGRGMRSPDDRCENFILDTHANWFLKPKSSGVSTSRSRGGFRHLFPAWFLNQVQYPSSQPKPPVALNLQL